MSLREYLVSLSEAEIPLVLKDFFPESRDDSHGMHRRRQATEMLVLIHSQASRLGDKDFIKWKTQFIGAYLKDLTMHEIGHALGLRHNFKASSLTPFAKLKDPAYLKENPISTSVMDYNDLLVTEDSKEPLPQLMGTLGAYDFVAIEYGYRDLPPKDLDRQLNGIAQSLVEKGLDYASDEDLWSSDPHVQTYDLGDDLLATAKERLLFSQKTLDSLDTMFLTTGSRMDQLERAIWALVGDYFRKTVQATHYIGGIHRNRDRMGDPKQRDAQVPVSFEKQMETLQYLKDNVFGEAALKIPKKLLQKSRSNPWNWGQPSTASSFQRMQILVRYSVLNMLLGSKVLTNLAEFHEKVSEKPFSRQLLFSNLHSMIAGNLASTDLPSEEIRHTQRFFASQLAEFVSGRRFVDDTSRLLAAHTLDLIRMDSKDRLGKLTGSRDYDSALLRRHLSDLVTIADTAFEAQIQKHRF
ncbi:MAG: zinc-dependent metalloprotease [Candidatus Cloacimonetes bacterium]|nr:zinc-dependent metalloprotease [Candidatus Cloacimonadota bacterium]